MANGSDSDPGPSGPPPGLVGAAHLGAMLPFLREAIYIFDRDANLKARLSAPDGILGHGAGAGTNLFAYLHPDDIPRGLQIGAAADEAPPGWSDEAVVRLRHVDGTWRRFAIRVTNAYHDPAIDGIVVAARELAPAPEAQPDHDLSSVADDLPTAYLALGQGGLVRYASEAAVALMGCPREHLLGLPIGELVIDADRPLVTAAYQSLLRATGARTVVATTRGRFGSCVVEAEFHTRRTDHDHKVVTVVLVDHTAEPELVRLATHDALTGLANRTKVLETINGMLLDRPPRLSLVYVDLDDLKGINDAHGHEAGDQALIAVAHRLEQMVRPSDLVGRMSGDEFVVVCPDLGGLDLLRFVQRLGNEAMTDLMIDAPDGTEVKLAVSAGGATAALGDTAASLLRQADEAMFAAKQHHR